MKTVALIGGIGSGKSYVSGVFADLGAAVINLDAIGHEVLEQPQVKDSLVEAFGQRVLGPDDRISRPDLAAAAFAGPQGVETLNGITHPAIWEEYHRKVALIKEANQFACHCGEASQLIVVEVTSGDISRESLAFADCVVAVSAPEELRLARATSRGHQSLEDVKRRMAAQPTDEQREAVADWCIDNSDDRIDLRSQVAAIAGKITQGQVASAQ